MITRKKPIRRVSSKRAKQLKEYSILRAEFLEKHPTCQVWLDENEHIWKSGGVFLNVYPHKSTDVHHRKSRIGKMLLDTRYWMAVSRTAHQRIHAFPKWAREKGYLLDK